MTSTALELSGWLERFSDKNILWYAKRLSGNDTLANGTHQAGPYVPREFLLRLFPQINQSGIKNPDVWFDFHVDSHSEYRKARAIWYNNSLFAGTRNEARLTNFGGRSSALLNPDNTGALTLFSFQVDENDKAIDCHSWVCRNEMEENLIENLIGPIDPGRNLLWCPFSQSVHETQASALTRGKCWLEPEQIPYEWRASFPKPTEIIRKSLELCQLSELTPDQRLMRRRGCELELFSSIEQAVELPRILAGFTSVDEFVARAQTILQRRKSRSGRSLELHLCEIFKEEKLVENESFSFQPTSEGKKQPDFLFPSESAYRNNAFPADQLRMLAVKTTCKDRWRQILSEADRVPRKHLLTLQEGLSRGQFSEMTDAGVQLVVPSRCIKFFPRDIQPKLQTLGSFITEVRELISI